jgi:hypothetical protein
VAGAQRRRIHDVNALRSARVRARRATLALSSKLNARAPPGVLAHAARVALREIGLLWEAAARMAE